VKAVADEFFAVAVTEYDPLAAVAADLTDSVALPVAPGASESDVGESVPVHPDGTTLVSVKDEVVHDALSEFVTESVNATVEPAATPALWEGDRLTVGLARTQGLATT